MRFINRKIRYLTFLISIIFLTSFTLFIVYSQQTEKIKKQTDNSKITLKTQIENDSKKFKVGEKITLFLTIENDSNDSIFFIESDTSRNYKVVVKNEKGESISLTDYGKRLTSYNSPIWRNKLTKLESGKSKTFKLGITQLYDISRKGKYYISVSRLVRKGENELIKIESNVVELKII